jgi:hypothetical protein
MAELLQQEPGTPAVAADDPHQSGEAVSGAETYGMTCAACGASLRIHEGERSVRCQYCNAALYVAAPAGVRTWILRASVSEGAARLAALHHLAEKTGGAVKARHTSILDLRLIYVPFWRMSGRLAGRISGDEVIRRVVETTVPGPDGTRVVKRTEEERSPFTKYVCKRIDWSTPACALRYLGLQGIALRTRMLAWDVFDHGMRETIHTALPMKTAERAREDGYRYLATLAAPSGSIVRSSRFDLLGEDLSIYYFPVYILRYRHGDRIYSTTIDASDGHVIRADVPERRERGSRALFIVPAVTAFLAGTWLPLVPIAAAALYIYDVVRAGAPVMPHRWIVARLGAWFGGGR